MNEIIEKIIEKLEQELKLANKEKERCLIENYLQFYTAKGYANGIANTIEIIKREAVGCNTGRTSHAVNQAVLVMDMPDQVCGNCLLCCETIDNNYMCAGSNGREIPDGEIPDWCPLRQMPLKKNYEKLSDGNPLKAWGNGWNACIDELEKGL